MSLGPRSDFKIQVILNSMLLSMLWTPYRNEKRVYVCLNHDIETVFMKNKDFFSLLVFYFHKSPI